MNITNITVSKTIQTAQYEPETVEAQAVLEEGDNFEKCAKQLRDQISSVLGRSNGSTTTTTTDTGAGKKETKKEAPKDTKKPSGAGKKEAPKKAPKSRKKNVPYNREVKAHQKELGQILHEVCPDWKGSDETKKLAKDASTNLTGEDFMDGEGVILDSFIEAVREAMTSESAGEDEEL